MKQEIEAKHQFAQELNSLSKTGDMPQSASSDVKYLLDLQQKRLHRNGIVMEQKLFQQEKDDTVKGSTKASNSSIFARDTIKSEKYHCTVDFCSMERELIFSKEGTQKYKRRENDVMYVTNTDVFSQNVTGTEAITCPNCGAVSTINELQNGCSYCNTKFDMSEIYPKYTGYYFLANVVAGKSLLIRSVKIWAYLGAILGGVGLCLGKNYYPDNIKGTYVGLAIGGAILGLVVGYLLWAFAALFFVIAKSAVSTNPIADNLKTKKKIVDLLHGFDPSFSYEYFVQKLISQLKIIVFSDDRSNLAFFSSNNSLAELDEILDMDFDSHIELNSYNVDNGICSLDINLYMDDIHYSNSKILRKHDCFRMVLKKNVTVPENLGFTIKSVNCKTCGGSFDATKLRTCPFCNSEYDAKHDTWMIQSIECH